MDAILKASLPKLREKLLEALQAVLPIVAIVLVLCFTIAPVSPSILLCFLLGAVLIVVGIMFFTLGAEMSMTPMGERVGAVLTRSRKLPVILGVGFLLGFLITISEPDLQVLANQVPSIPNQTLIFSVAAGVGLFLTVAFLRMLLGVALPPLLVAFYGLVFVLAAFVPREFLAVAFDSGGVTTGPMTVPFIMALGVGVSAIRGDRHAADDSFGLVALCSVGPILAVLILLNTYPLITSENLTFRSKQSSLQGSVSVMVTALSGLEELSEENVAGAMTLVEETGISRVLVTDASGRVLYDTRETDGAIGRYAFYTELVQALRGEDVFYTEFSDKAFKSRAASPVIYHSQTIGAVYAYEYDTEQAELLLSLQRNLLTISAVVLVFAGGISVLLSRVLTRRFGVLTDAIRKMREGSYSHRAEVGGHDEISELAAEFNDMADRLQTTEDARRRFVSDASHELKTPLAGIRLLSDSILQTENMDAQTVREFVGDIEQESERLARITENLLRLTRLDSGMLPEAQRVDLSSVMAHVVRMLRLVAEEKQVDLSCEIRREGHTLASEDEIHEIIYNLTENAIKYNRPGGFVKLLLAGDEKDCLLTVSDNGIGIPEGDMPRIFDRFYRVDKMRSRAAGGTGLGLSIAADTARRRGGSIEVRAREGGGTVFTVRLPRCEEGGDET